MLRYASLITLTIVLASCSSSSFVGRKFDNFNAYYNTFYNAERVFAEAERSIEVKDPPVNTEIYLDVFVVPDRVANRQNFENSIKKSADVLREHENSKWVDDALLLIGKSYFYTQNYVSARRYFGDVIEVSEKLDGEAQAWLGRTLLASGNYADAEEHLTTTLASDDLSRRWAPALQLQLGSVYVKTGNYEDAVTQLVQGIDAVKDKDLKARANFLLGQVYETLGNTSAALEAFDRAGRHEALYELSFAGQSRTIELMASSDPEEALKRLRRMERDDKNFNYESRLSYLRARVDMEQENWIQARDQLKTALSEGSRVNPASAGHAHYALGSIYENYLVDYSKAAAHYDTAATSLRTTVQQIRTDAIRSGITQPFAPGAITDASGKAEVFGAYAAAYSQVADIDSLLALGALDEESFDRRIQELRRQRLADLEQQRREKERQEIAQQFRNSGQGSGTGIESERNKGNLAGGENGQALSEAGFLYHKDPVRMRAGVQNFIEIWGSRPLVDNWRIESKLIRESTAASGEAGAAPGEGPVTLENIEFLPPIDVSDVPRTPAARLEARQQRAEARYLVGNVLFLSMDKPDSAAYWYNLVVTEDAEFEVSERASYALVEAMRSAGNPSAADDLRQRIIRENPDSPFARRLAAASDTSTVATPVDSIEAHAVSDYGAAFDKWVDEGRHEEAFDGMLAIAASYPESESAPRALLASTSIYADWARQHSIDPLEPIRFSVSDSIVQRLGLQWSAVRTNAVDSTMMALPDSVDSGIVDSAFVDSANTDTASVDPVPADTATVDTATVDPARTDSTSDDMPRSLEESAGADSSAVMDQMPDAPRKGKQTVDRAPQEEETIIADSANTVNILEADERRPVNKPAAELDRRKVVTDSLNGSPKKKAGQVALPDSPTDTLAVANTGMYVDSIGSDSMLNESALHQSALNDSTMSEPDGASYAIFAPDSDSVLYLADIFNLITDRYPDSQYASEVASLVLTTAEESGLAEAPEDAPQGEDVSGNRPNRRGVDAGSGETDKHAGQEGDAGPGGEVSEVRGRRQGGDQSADDPESSDEGEDEIVVADASEVASEPALVGGIESLQRRVRFPEEVGEYPDGGIVIVEFVVTKDGFVTNPNVVAGLGAGFDDEAIRVIRQTRFRPAINSRSQPVPFQLQLEINFQPVGAQ